MTFFFRPRFFPLLPRFLTLCTLLLLGFISSPQAAKKRRSPKRQGQAKTLRNQTRSSAEKNSAVSNSEPTRKQRIAVLRLGALGISSAVKNNLEMLLRNSINTIQGADIISAVDIEIALQDPKNRETASCGGGPGCAQKVARLVGADTVVFGNIGAIGEAYNLNLRALDTHSGKEIARQQIGVSGNRDLLIPEIRLAAYRLIAPDKITGSLLVQIDAEGVQVEIDGKIVGVTPLKSPIENIPPGQHVIVLKRPGYSEFQQEFSIRPFETARIKLDMKQAQPETPPLSSESSQ